MELHRSAHKIQPFSKYALGQQNKYHNTKGRFKTKELEICLGSAIFARILY
jgi:hypothetical protein